MVFGSWPGYGLKTLQRKASRLSLSFADLIWPPVSPLSGDVVSSHGALSGRDWLALSFIERPWCDRCGRPFDYDLGEGVVCAPCAQGQSELTRLRSVLVYDDASRPLILGFKHGGRTEGLAAFGPWLHRLGVDLWPGCDGVIPVPLHPRRVRQRGFNQALLLAQALHRAGGPPIETNLIRRKRYTPPQEGKGYKARVRNVAGVFQCPEKMLYKISGKSFVLIDDVYTTGATLEACARLLRRAGAKSVAAVTLARVVKPIDTTL